MKKYIISANRIRVTRHLYDKTASAVLFHGSREDCFQTIETIGVQQGSVLSTTIFNMFLENNQTDALDDREGSISTAGRTNTNLRFADDIDGSAGEKEELAKLVERLFKTSTAYGMEISAKKTKLITNNNIGIIQHRD